MKRPVNFRSLMIIVFWFAVWQVASLIIDNAIIFVGPVDVIRSFSVLVFRPDFWQSIAQTFYKISLGFVCASIAGILIGCLACRYHILLELLEPLVQLMKSVPVASFVILALIWFGSKNLSIFISFTIVFPVMYINTIAGLASTDIQLLEMARVFRIPALKKARYIYVPALTPYLVSGCNVALGMGWKSGIAAEVIGVPSNTIGEHLYLSKIYLNTAELFAWTIVIIMISACFEKLILKLIKQVTV
ncbi:MAG: ABC transporter permease [Lachnospiraceae bacterium]